MNHDNNEKNETIIEIRNIYKFIAIARDQVTMRNAYTNFRTFQKLAKMTVLKV